MELELLLIFIYAVAAVIGIAALVKFWGMANNVKQIKSLLEVETYSLNWPSYEMLGYGNKQIARAKRMKAIGDADATKILKGLIYDTKNYMEVNQNENPNLLDLITKAEEILSEMS